MKWIALALLLIFLGSKIGKKVLKFILSLLVMAGVLYLVFTWCVGSVNDIFNGDLKARDEAISSMVEQAKDKETWKEAYFSMREDFVESEMYSSIQSNFEEFKSTLTNK